MNETVYEAVIGALSHVAREVRSKLNDVKRSPQRYDLSWKEDLPKEWSQAAYQEIIETLEDILDGLAEPFLGEPS